MLRVRVSDRGFREIEKELEPFLDEGYRKKMSYLASQKHHDEPDLEWHQTPAWADFLECLLDISRRSSGPARGPTSRRVCCVTVRRLQAMERKCAFRDGATPESVLKMYQEKFESWS